MRDLIPRKEFGTMTNRLFDEFWNEIDKFLSPSLNNDAITRIHKFSYPKINIKQTDAEYIVEAGVPGLTKEDVKVEYADGLLTISAQNQNSSSKEQNGYLVRELHRSAFTRSVTVDEVTCDVENIVAGVENGILTIKIPKKEVDKPEPKRIIEVK